MIGFKSGKFRTITWSFLNRVHPYSSLYCLQFSIKYNAVGYLIYSQPWIDPGLFIRAFKHFQVFHQRIENTMIHFKAIL